MAQQVKIVDEAGEHIAEVGSDKRLRVQAEISGSLPSLVVEDLAGNPVELTAELDGSGKAVLRIVDSAPWGYDSVTDAQKVYEEIKSRATVETLISAVSVAAAGVTSAAFTADGADELWFLINIDKNPWTAAASMGPWTAVENNVSLALWPERKDHATPYPTVLSPARCLYISNINAGDAASYPVTTLEEAMRIRAVWDGRIYITNKHATDAATITVKILRVWR